MSAALVFTKTGRDALFFLENGLFYLPAAYLGIAVLSPLTAVAVLVAMRRLGPRRVRIGGPLVTAFLLLGFFAVARPGGGLLMTGFFVLVPLTFGVLFAMAWLLAAELLQHLPRRGLARPYSLIGGAAISGGILAGLAARAASGVVEPRYFILLGALCLSASALVLALAQRTFCSNVARPPPGPLGMRSQVKRVVRQPYVRLLFAISVAAAAAGILIEFQFYLAAATSGNDARDNAALFAGLYTVLNVGALVVQLLLVPELQRWLGIGGSLSILPGALVGGAAGLLASSSLAMRGALKAGEGGLKSSVHRSNWEQAFLPIGAESRGVAKLLIDGLGSRVGEGIAAASVLAWLTFVVGEQLEGRSTTWLTLLLLGAAAAWLTLTRRLRREMRVALRHPESATAAEELGLGALPPDT
ncbi:MAG: hypothetical protein ACE5HP_09545 [Gemmatimonadota bacterium]